MCKYRDSSFYVTSDIIILICCHERVDSSFFNMSSTCILIFWNLYLLIFGFCKGDTITHWIAYGVWLKLTKICFRNLFSIIRQSFQVGDRKCALKMYYIPIMTLKSFRITWLICILQNPGNISMVYSYNGESLYVCNFSCLSLHSWIFTKSFL